MVEIIGVRFKSGGKQYYFDPNGLTVQAGQDVIVETSRGVEYGQCSQGNTQIQEEAVVQPLRPCIRVATEEDKLTVARNKEKEEKAFQICQEKILAHGLEMKLVDAEYSFEGNKVLFFFTAEGRVDFRALVKDLASTIHARIELRQIGVRDEAKMLGGLGICGRPFCCSQFLDEFQPVSIKMAKTQNLSLNPTKISGTCGRLMCCLKYEQEAYEDLLKRAPKAESLVETPDGVGTVTQVNLLREKVKVRLDKDPESPQYYSNNVIRVVRSGKGKRPEGYELPEQPETPAPTRLRHSAPAQPQASVPQALVEETPPPQSGQGEGPAGEVREDRPHRGRSRRNHSHAKPRSEGEQQILRQQQGEEAKQRPPQGVSQAPKESGEPGQSGEQRSHRSRPRRRRPRGSGGQNSNNQGKSE